VCHSRPAGISSSRFYRAAVVVHRDRYTRYCSHYTCWLFSIVHDVYSISRLDNKVEAGERLFVGQIRVSDLSGTSELVKSENSTVERQMSFY
jgi:hypothetical protein